MNNNTRLGIFMDHAAANLITFPTNAAADLTIRNNFTQEAKAAALQRGESAMHTKEQSETADYYSTLADHIIEYEEVLLFGPTDAKTELYHTFEHNYLYAHVNVSIMQTDKMTDNQKNAFVKTFFEDEQAG